MNFNDIVEKLESKGHEVSFYVPLMRRVFEFGFISICDADDTLPVICKIDKENSRYPLKDGYKTVLAPERRELLHFVAESSYYQSDLNNLITTKKSEEPVVLLLDGIPTYWPRYGRDIDNLETFDLEVETHQELIDKVHEVIPEHNFA